MPQAKVAGAASWLVHYASRVPGQPASRPSGAVEWPRYSRDKQLIGRLAYVAEIFTENSY